MHERTRVRRAPQSMLQKCLAPRSVVAWLRQVQSKSGGAAGPLPRLDDQ